MSLSFAASPALVAGAGAAMLIGLPFVQSIPVSLGVLKGLNATAFLINVASVSVPGRIDEAQDQAMRRGDLNPSKPSGRAEEPQQATSETPLVSSNPPAYTTARTRSIVNPAGWAFAIWGPIYLGEAAFCGAQIFSNSTAWADVLPQVTFPFVAANLFQSLWCASFRPSYAEGWHKYISVGMLAGTAYSLSLVQAAAPDALFWYFLPMSLHFGWTTAATLVNLNGSVAMSPTVGDSKVIAVGHASALAATAMGVGITLAQAAPAYGFTVAWALAACGQGTSRAANSSSETLQTGAKVQKVLCLAGSAACVATSLYTIFA